MWICVGDLEDREMKGGGSGVEDRRRRVGWVMEGKRGGESAKAPFQGSVS